MTFTLNQIATICSPFCDIENFDKIEGELRNGWMKSSIDEVSSVRSDERFI